MKEIELRSIGGHVEVYSEAGVFLFSADTVQEALQELVQDDLKRGGTIMKEIELRSIGGHVEVYSEAGVFLFSADTVQEALQELEQP